MAEVVLVGGMPAGGKTTVTKRFVDQGYTRLNRDALGGKVNDLISPMLAALRAGKNVVMDNLYATKASRAEVLKAAKDAGVDVHFVLMDTSLEDAQFNACCRMMERCGKILDPEDHKDPKYKNDPNLFPVAVLYKYRKEFEKPSVAEGFASVKTEKFVRVYPADWVNGAVIFDFDGTLIAEHNGEQRSVIAFLYCPHKVPPITCYCRKPGPGMGVELIFKYKLDPRKCTYVGDMTTDKTFAARCGFKFVDHSEYFR